MNPTKAKADRETREAIRRRVAKLQQQALRQNIVLKTGQQIQDERDQIAGEVSP